MPMPGVRATLAVVDAVLQSVGEANLVEALEGMRGSPQFDAVRHICMRRRVSAELLERYGVGRGDSP